MRASGPPRTAHVSELFAAPDFLAFRHCDLGKMRVVSLVVVAVVDDDQPSVTKIEARELHPAITGGLYRCTRRCGDIDPGMVSALTGKRILPPSESTHQAALHRPSRGEHVSLE